MNGLSGTRVLRLAAGGAAGGLVTYVLLNPAMRERELSEGYAVQSFNELISVLLTQVVLLGIVLGAAVGMALVAVEEALSRRIGRLVRMTIAAGIVGAFFGAVGSIAAQAAFSLLLTGGRLQGDVGFSPVLILARTLGWAIIGVAAGVCPGITARSWLRIRQGAMGGLLGGGAGGLLFDMLGLFTQEGSISRFVGFVLIGAVIGALVGLIEEFGKEFWLTALTGAKEGRAFILSKPQTWLGRDELVDIPLFGDPSVQRRHAVLTNAGGAMMVAAQPGLFVTVNRQPVSGGPLQEGDLLGIGQHVFRFHARRASRPISQPVPVDGAPANPMPAVPAEAAGAARLTRLQALAGPHQGEVFPLIHGAILGRDPRCDIALLRDIRASRQHARLLLEGAAWRIEDGNSANGLWVNGQRVTMQWLAPGDEIGVGETLLQVQ